MHIVSYGSNVVRRVCNSTIKAETYQLQLVVENGDLVRAAFADCHGLLDRRNWEASAASFCTQVWFTDCKSCFDTLQKPVPTKGTDKRIGIELAALRQCLWRRSGEERADPRLYDSLPDTPTDICHWIDTTIMIADPLTKAMKSTEMMTALDTNFWCWTQPEDAKATKAKKQIQRHSSKDAKKEIADQKRKASRAQDREQRPAGSETTGDQEPWLTPTCNTAASSSSRSIMRSPRSKM
jgi:hypothetical protein